MPLRLIIAASVLTVAVVLAIASEGSAQKPPKPGATSLKASAQQVTFSQPIALSGKVKGAKQGVTVTIERRAVNSTSRCASASSVRYANNKSCRVTVTSSRTTRSATHRPRDNPALQRTGRAERSL